MSQSALSVAGMLSDGPAARVGGQPSPGARPCCPHELIQPRRLGDGHEGVRHKIVLPSCSCNPPGLVQPEANLGGCSVEQLRKLCSLFAIPNARSGKRLELISWLLVANTRSTTCLTCATIKVQQTGGGAAARKPAKPKQKRKEPCKDVSAHDGHKEKVHRSKSKTDTSKRDGSKNKRVAESRSPEVSSQDDDVPDDWNDEREEQLCARQWRELEKLSDRFERSDKYGWFQREELQQQEQELGMAAALEKAAAERQHTSDEVARAVIEVGQAVMVESRIAPGINRPGGAARVARVHEDGSCDVKYVLHTGVDTHVPAVFVKPIDATADGRVRRRVRAPRASRPSEKYDPTKEAARAQFSHDRNKKRTSLESGSSGGGGTGGVSAGASQEDAAAQGTPGEDGEAESEDGELDLPMIKRRVARRHYAYGETAPPATAWLAEFKHPGKFPSLEAFMEDVAAMCHAALRKDSPHASQQKPGSLHREASRLLEQWRGSCATCEPVPPEFRVAGLRHSRRPVSTGVQFCHRSAAPRAAPRFCMRTAAAVARNPEIAPHRRKNESSLAVWPLR